MMVRVDKKKLMSAVRRLLSNMSKSVPVLIGGELVSSGVSLIAVVAFIVSWVTVGVVQLPAESLMLGRRFALVRKSVSFVAGVAPEIALDGFRVFLKMGRRILPVLAVVFGLLFLFNLFVKTEAVTRVLGKGRGKVGWLIATFLYNRAVKTPLLPVMIYYFGVELVTVLTVYMILFSIINGYMVERLQKRTKGGAPDLPSPRCSPTGGSAISLR